MMSATLLHLSRCVKRNTLIVSTLNRKLSQHNASNILCSQIKDIEIPNLTISEFVFQTFDKYPNKIALECSLSGKRYTFNQIRQKSLNVGRNLQTILKLSKGDVVAVMLPNVPEFAICVLGALQAGLIVTSVNPSFTPDEIARQLVDSNAKAVICMVESSSSVLAVRKLIKKEIPVLTTKLMQSEQIPDGVINLHEFMDAESKTPNWPKIHSEDVALLPYSSGTTGMPKGVQLTHRNIVANICQISVDELQYWVIPSETQDNVVPGILPWFHIFGITNTLLAQLHLLSKVISVPKFSPRIFINVLEKHKPNVLFVVPPMVSLMSHDPLVKQKFFDPIKTVMCGAAPLGKADEEKLIRKAARHINILQGYGLTETSPAVCMASAEKKNELGFTGSVGGLIPNTTVKLISIDGKQTEIVRPNESGEILVRGPQVMKAYLNHEKETNNAFLNGWFRTGDIGYYDNNQMFYITDRIKELIKVKGFAVAPAELEELIRSHHAVSEVGVIGIPNEKYGEVPRAYVVPKLNSKINVEELKHYVCSKVIEYKHLRGGIVVIDNLPKTPSGKVLRNKLKLQYKNEGK